MITCVGPIFLDRVVKIDSFPKKPIKLVAKGLEKRLGGPAAVASFAVTILGESSELVSRFGDDDAAEFLQSELDKYNINFENSTNSGIFTDIQYRGKKARVYNLHLESLRINFKDTLITNRNSEGLQLKFNQVFKKQLDQIGQFEKIDKQNPFPSIVCTDLNNSQFSVIYRALKKDKNDVFKEAGTGLGTTFNFSFFPLRIDFIFVDEDFKVNSFEVIQKSFSDHYPIITTLGWD